MSGTTTDPASTPESTPAPEPTTILGAPPAEAPKPEAPKTSTDPVADPAKPEEPKAEEPKAEEKPVVPEKYEFTAPEGVTLDTAAIEQFSVLAKEAGLTQEAAQKLVDFQVSRDTEGQKAAMKSFQDMVTGWADQTRKDPEIGGAKFDQNVAQANKALDAYGTPALKEVLSNMGWGNHPELVRFCARVGATLQEASVLPGGGGQEGQARNPAELIFAKTIAEAAKRK